MYQDIDEILYSREVIEERVKELAAQVVGVYREHDLTVAVTLKGAFLFASDLVRHLAQQVDIVFLSSNSYGDGTSPQQSPEIRLPHDVDWAGRHVLLVEDIVDTGHTISALTRALDEQGAESVRICTFLDKPVRREVEVDIDFVGFELEGAPFVVGYGLDAGGRYRNLPFVGTLKSPEG